MFIENLLGIPQRQVWYRSLCMEKLIGYPSKGDEKRSLELRINISREFIGHPLMAGLVWGCYYTKAYRVSLKGR
jgi:hypothetical protein